MASAKKLFCFICKANKITHPDRIFFNFPSKVAPTYSKWMDVIPKYPIKRVHRICSYHFDSRQYCRGRIIDPYAVPSLHLEWVKPKTSRLLRDMVFQPTPTSPPSPHENIVSFIMADHNYCQKSAQNIVNNSNHIEEFASNNFKLLVTTNDFINLEREIMEYEFCAALS